MFYKKPSAFSLQLSAVRNNFFLLSAICYLLSTVFLGCATEYNIATENQELIFYDTNKEVKIGQSVAREIEKKYKISENPLLRDRVKAIGEKIAAVSDRKELLFHFDVLEARDEKDEKDINEEVNAVSLPGGYIYCFKGLFEKAKPTDDELAGVLAHEVAHVAAKHSLKKLQGSMAYTILRVVAAMGGGGGDVGQGMDAAFFEVMTAYSREDELLADRLGARYSKSAGYDPRGMISFLDKMREIDRKKPLRPLSYGRTHPFGPDRVRVVKQEIGEGMSFSDYINIETREHGQR